jgi:hypothetical protein
MFGAIAMYDSDESSFQRSRRMAKAKKVYKVGPGGTLKEYDVLRETDIHYVIGYSRVVKGAEEPKPYDTSPPKVYTTDRQEALRLKAERLAASIERSGKYLAQRKAELAEAKRELRK